MQQIKKILLENLWVVFSFIFIFFAFQHGDLGITVRGSVNFLSVAYPNFYEEAAKYTGPAGLNYLPSTYILFAIWGIPLKLIGLLPDPALDIGYSIYYYKLLPVIFYFASAFLIKNIAKELNHDEAASTWVAKLWLISPLAFFSQFIFGQYDVFTLFFTLLGILFYFKKDLYRFALFFGIAVTFKYFPLFIFMPLILLIEKDIKRLIKAGIILTLPFIITTAPFFIMHSQNFKDGVFGFEAAHRVFGVAVNNGISSFSVLFFLWFLVSAYVYFFEEGLSDFKEKAIRYAGIVSSGVFFFIFWHPQWLLFTTPFLLLNLIYKKTIKAYLFLQIALGVTMSGVTVHFFGNNVDQRLVSYGILGRIFPDVVNSSVRMPMMANFFYPRDGSLWLALFNALLVIGMIFSYRNFKAGTELATEADFEENRCSVKAYALFGIWFFAAIGLICYLVTVVRYLQFIKLI